MSHNGETSAVAHQISTSGFMPLVDAAAWAGVSPRTMHRWIDQGLPRYQAGPRAKVLLRAADIEAFLERQQAAKPDLIAMLEEVLKGMAGN